MLAPVPSAMCKAHKPSLGPTAEQLVGSQAQSVAFKLNLLALKVNLLAFPTRCWLIIAQPA